MAQIQQMIRGYVTKTGLLNFALCLFFLPNLLWFSFAGYISVPLALFAGLFICMAVLYWNHRMLPQEADNAISLRVLLACLLLALVLNILGGQGRFLFANIDWQIRDPLFQDLVNVSWPFQYLMDGHAFMLRAPLAFYLLPTALAKLMGPSLASTLLLAHSTLLLGTLFALATTLVERLSSKIFLLLLVVFFGGLEIFSSLFFALRQNSAFTFDRLEGWAMNYQFSSTITQLFWVPHHALPAIFFAVLYLLWLRKKLHPLYIACFFPMQFLWSPLTAMGTMLFVAHVAWVELRKGLLPVKYFYPAAAIFMLCLPVIIYLRSGTQDVPVHVGLYSVGDTHLVTFHASDFFRKRVLKLVLFYLIQVIPFLTVLIFVRKHLQLQLATVVCIALWLFGCPFVYLGEGGDFNMRSSMPSLDVLAFLMALTLLFLFEQWRTSPRMRMQALLVALMLLLGSATGVSDIVRAFSHPAIKADLCNFPEAWHASEFSNLHMSTYLAETNAMPSVFRAQHPTIVVVRNQTGPCWHGSWYYPWD